MSLRHKGEGERGSKNKGRLLLATGVAGVGLVFSSNSSHATESTTGTQTTGTGGSSPTTTNSTSSGPSQPSQQQTSQQSQGTQSSQETQQQTTSSPSSSLSSSVDTNSTTLTAKVEPTREIRSRPKTIRKPRDEKRFCRSSGAGIPKVTNTPSKGDLVGRQSTEGSATRKTPRSPALDGDYLGQDVEVEESR